MKKLPIWLPVILVGHLFLLWNLQFTAWPEMLGYPYLWVKGFGLYKDFIYPYPPLLTVILGGVFKVFGFKVGVLKGFTWFLILASDVVVYLLAKRVIKERRSVFLVMGVYVLVQAVLDGNMLWFDNAVVLPVVAGGYFLARWMEERREKWLVLTGLVLGLAIMIKQTAGLFGLVPLVVVMLSAGKERMKSLLMLAVLVVLLSGGMMIFLLVGGGWGSCWEWLIYYPFSFWTNFPGYVNFNLQRGEWFTLVILSLPVILGFTQKSLWREKFFWMVLGFVVVGVVAVYPRWSYFHLQPAFGFLLLLWGMVWKGVRGWGKVGMGVLVFLILWKVVWPGIRVNWGGEVRFWRENDREMVEIIKAETGEDERVFLQGLPAHYYALSGRLPPEHWSDNFGWYLEIPGVQEWVIEGFEEQPAEVVFWRVPRAGNWFDLGVYQPEKIVKYLRDNYNLEREVEEGVELWRKRS